MCTSAFWAEDYRGFAQIKQGREGHVPQGDSVVPFQGFQIISSFRGQFKNHHSKVTQGMLKNDNIFGTGTNIAGLFRGNLRGTVFVLQRFKSSILLLEISNKENLALKILQTIP